MVPLFCFSGVLLQGLLKRLEKKEEQLRVRRRMKQKKTTGTGRCLVEMYLLEPMHCTKCYYVFMILNNSVAACVSFASYNMKW